VAELAHLRQGRATWRRKRQRGTSVGSVTYEGVSLFRLIPARGSTARVSGYGVEMTVYPAVEGKPSAALQIHVPMSPNEARRLAAQLTTSAMAADRKKRR
jgi:hypothetical protein